MTAGMFHEVTVSRRRFLSPGMVRLTFTGEALDQVRATGIADEYLRLFFPDDVTGETVLPIISADGRWQTPEGKPPVRCSTYTVRRFDSRRREMDIDFVVHAGGLASEWAQTAEPGHSIVINNPRGLYQPSPDLRWQLLMADATGLPALARLLEQKRDNVFCRVVIEVASEEDRQSLPECANTQITWIYGGNGVTKSRIGEVFALIPLPPGAGHIWVSAEQTAVRAIRKRVKDVLALPAESCKLVAYWIDGDSDRPQAAALNADVVQSLSAAWLEEEVDA